MTKQELGDLIIAFTDDYYRIAKAILKEDADFKIREIADILEMSESAIKMRLNRGKIQLRTMFEKEAAI